MKPPTFFLSSTIYDFHDLRSAIKYYLEQQGCRVLASDHNDFTKPLDVHSYEACLKAISQADYFILLIGARVGGWYDEVAKVSITQAEYREGYRLHLQKKLKLLSFVRSDVWNLKDERKLLAKHLETLGYDHGARNQILSSPSKAATDAEFIANFIQEVSKNKETIEAQRGKAPFPTGNWLHVFSSFQEIIEPIQIQAFAGVPVAEVALRRLLRLDLREILRKCLIGGAKGPKAFTPRIAIQKFYAALPEPLTFRGPDETMVHTERYRTLVSFWIHIMQTKFFPQVLSEAIHSSAFVDFDPKTGEMIEQPVHAALVKLSMEIQNLKSKDNLDIPKLLLDQYPLGDQPEFMPVNKMKLLILLHSIDRWSNITDLCKAILLYLDGKPFVLPNLRPQSPFYEKGELDQNFATPAQIDEFLAEPFSNLPNIRSVQDLGQAAGTPKTRKMPARKQK